MNEIFDIPRDMNSIIKVIGVGGGGSNAGAGGSGGGGAGGGPATSGTTNPMVRLYPDRN